MFDSSAKSLWGKWLRWFSHKPVKRGGVGKRPRQRVRLQCEMLEDRTSPAVFTVTNFSEGPGGLRDAILQANANSDASNTINLQAANYQLTNAAAGNLLIANTAALPSKTLTIAGVGQNSSIIAGGSGWADRII